MTNVFTMVLISSLFTGMVMLIMCASDKKLGARLSPKMRTLAATLTLLLQPVMLAVATVLSFASDIFGKVEDAVTETVTTVTSTGVIDNFVAPVTTTTATAVQDSSAVGVTTGIALPDFNTVMKILACLWLAGVAVTALYKIVSYLRFVHNLKKSLTPCDCGTQIPAFTSPQAGTPFLMGFFREKIILPEKQMDEAELELAIKHEMIHHKRHDIQKKFFAEMLKCLNWFNPAFYVFAGKLSELSELTVDEILSSELDYTGRKAYGGLLLKFASAKEEPVLCTDLSKGAKSLAERLELIVSDEKPKPTKGEKIALSVLVAATLAVIGISVSLCMTAVPTIVPGLEIDSGNADEIIRIDLSNEGMEPYKLDSPVNPLIDADFSGSIVFIHRYGWGGVTDQIIMDDEDTAEFVSYLENADMDSTPTVDENTLFGGWTQEYTVELNTGELVLVSLVRRDSYYIMINDFLYTIDYDSYAALATYYDEVYLDDAKKYSVSRVEYDYLSGNLTEEEYAEEKQNLIDIGVIESEEEYYEVLSELDGELFGFDLETDEEVTDLSSDYLVESPYTLESGPKNPLLGMDLSGSLVSVEIYSPTYGDNVKIYLSDEDTAIFISCLENAEMSETPTGDEITVEGGLAIIFDILETADGEVYSIAFIQLEERYIMINNYLYVIDRESFDILSPLEPENIQEYFK